MSQRNDRPGRSQSPWPGITSELRRAAWLTGGALVAIAMTVAGLSIFEDGTQRWVHQSREVSRLARTALTYALDAETGVRGYLVTHKRQSLEPEIAAEPKMRATIDSIVELTSDNRSQEKTAIELQTATNAWWLHVAQPAITTGTTAAVSDSGLAGKALFDVVRDRANRLVDAEDALYVSRLDRNQRAHRMATAAVCLEILLALIGLAWFVRQIMTHVGAEEETQGALERQAVELEEQAAELEEQAAELEMANDDLGHAVAEARDARTRAEAETRQKTRLAALFDAALGCAPTGFGFFDHDLRFLRVNAMLARIHGMAEEDLIGLTLDDLDPQLSREVTPVLRQVMETRSAVMNVPFRGKSTAGRQGPRDWLSSFFPIITRDGELFGIGVVITDVTEYKRLEEQLLQAQKMEAVGRLAGGIAHDFNNLLTVINSYAELMLYDPAMQHGKEEVQEIRGATARAAKLTRQLLAFSRRQAMEPRIVNPNDVVRGVENLLRRLVVGNIDIRTHLSAETPMIRVDPGQLEQVLMNLTINAADAMPEGGHLTIDTACEMLDDAILRSDSELVPGDYALIRVRDTGHGMDAATVKQIFEPFFTTKEPGRGTGLGLSTVYGIIKQFSGHVAVDSAPGTGTVFTVYLPAVGKAVEVVAHA